MSRNATLIRARNLVKIKGRCPCRTVVRLPTTFEQKQALSHNKTTKFAASSQPWDVVWASATSYEPSSTATPAEAGTNC